MFRFAAVRCFLVAISSQRKDKSTEELRIVVVSHSLSCRRLDVKSGLSCTKSHRMQGTHSSARFPPVGQLDPAEHRSQMFRPLWPGNVDGMSGVQIGPGATALTRIDLSASACESERVKDVIAPLVEE